MMMSNLTAPLSAILTAIFLAGGVGAANYDPALSEPVVAAPSGIWQEVRPDMRTVPIFEPRDPGPCDPSGSFSRYAAGKNRPCVGITDGVDYTSRPKSGASVTWWVLRGPGGNGNKNGNAFGPCNNPSEGRPWFCDSDPDFWPPSYPRPPVEPPVAPVPLPMSLYMLVAGIFGLGVVRFFPQSLIDRPDRNNGEV